MEARVNFRPRDDYILVQPVKRKQSDILEVISGEKYTQGTVIAVGPGKVDKKGRLRSLTTKPGDFVTYGDINRGYDFYPKYEKDGVTYRILQEADICFIADPEAPEHNLPADQIAQLVSAGKTLDLTPIPMTGRQKYDAASDSAVSV